MKHLLSRIRPEVFLFLLFLFAGSYFYYTVDYDNTSSRLYAVSAIADFGVLHIDPYASMTTDKSWSDGHAYSNKAIGAPLLAVPIYWALRKMEPSNDSPPLTKRSRYWIRLTTTTLPFAFLGPGLFRLARTLGCAPTRCLLAACSYGLGSIALIHAGLFSGHGIAAALSFFSFMGLMSRRRSTKQKRGMSSGDFMDREAGSEGPGDIAGPPASLSLGFLLGFSAGMAALADYTAMYISGILLLYALLSPLGGREKAGFIMGGLVCALLLASYNWKCFGSPLAFSYARQMTEAFAQESQHGLLGIGVPKWNAVLSLLGSPSRGLFFIMPVFLFSLEGIRRMLKSPDFRGEGVVISSIALGYVLIVGGFYGWHGGWSFGPRYFIPMLPFLALSMAFSNWELLPFFLSLGVSVLQVQIVAMGLPHCPEAIQNPLVELVIPLMAEGYMAETWPGWLGLPASWALLLYVGICGTLFLGAWTSTRELKPRKDGRRSWQMIILWGLLLWLAAMGLMMNAHKTDPPELVSLYKERLQYHRVHWQEIERHIGELAESYGKAEGSRKDDKNSPSAREVNMAPKTMKDVERGSRP